MNRTTRRSVLAGSLALLATPAMAAQRLADLIVTALRWSDDGVNWSTGPIPDGAIVQFEAVVRNQGRAATPSSQIIRVDFTANGQFADFATRPGSLARRASATLRTVNGWSVPGPGTFSIVARVDPSLVIPESNESNNTRSASLTVEGQPEPGQDVVPIWFANHETGDLSQWEGIWNSGAAQASVSSEQAHGGTRSAKLTIGNGGTRLAVHGDNTTRFPGSKLPDSAYYSCWYYFPQVVTPASWWNVFQWKRAWDVNGTKSSDPLYTINVDNRTNGAMFFYVYRHVGTDGAYNTSGQGIIASAPSGIDIPVGQWVHFESLYTFNTTASGQLRSWMNGQELWNLTGLITEYGAQKYLNHSFRPRQWTVNNYSDNIGGSQSIYVDDAVIANERIYGKAVQGL